MMRPAVLIWLVLIAAASAFVYVTGRQVDALEAQLERVNRQIVAESEAIRVLRSEWSYLNRPERLRSLVRELTALEPAGVGHIAEGPAAIPYPLPEPGDVVSLAATRIPGFSQLPVPTRHPEAGPPPPPPAAAPSATTPAAEVATAPVAGPGEPVREQPAEPPRTSRPVSPADRDDPIGALLASLDPTGTGAAGPGGGPRP
ncbi:MAG: hypothetical protein GVY13_00040 [Alphaproteobacteria bacterium]|jgi:hypothetical protein|nr:hypothetical protein [Alphaproteobacteria bacterium]